MTPRVGEAAAVDGIAGTLQAMVGQRETGSDSLGFALRALAAIGIDVTSQPGISALESVDELLVAAGSSDAVDATGLALPGDLVIFGDPDEPRSLSLVGVVAAVHPRGDRTEPCAAGATAACPTSPAIQTLEFVVLDRGVVRRGYLTPAAPDRARDSQGRVLNTFIRPLDRGTSMQAKFLAGELLRAVIRSERL